MNTSQATISDILQQQRTFFASGATKDVEFRIRQLKKFRATIRQFEKRLYDALWADLHKSPEEAFLTEISIVLLEINNHIKHLRKWAKPKRVATPLHLLPSSSRILYEPLGVSLIIAPWNYPFQLLMNPLVGAISAGCCALLKPSPYTPATAQVMEELVAKTFDNRYIRIVQGNREVNQFLLKQKFDVIFFTGSPELGKNVMESAAVNLTPVVLELGGKSPCIVDKNANIRVSAKRIAWGKTINAGQTCIAPDYLFIHTSVKEKFVEEYKRAIAGMYGEDVRQSPYFARIVNQKAVERLKKLMLHGDIIFGGQVDENERYIAPTLIDHVHQDDPVMQEEIFGPLLPIMTFEKIEEVIDYVNAHEKPLAFYYFGEKKPAKTLFERTSSGGGCINDTLLHIANHHLPFGGVGNSGMGIYHGQESFWAFSNKRALVSSLTWFDLAMKYAPFRYFSVIKRILSA
jgi:aldehyde dehydrogenase (NAD+)